MPRDVLEQLADKPVPPVPVTFDRSVHDRLNRWLLVGQLLDLALKAMGYTLLHFSRAVLGLLTLTVTGKFEPGRKDGPGSAP